MMADASWVGAIDHRISSAVVFFMLMLLLNTPPKRKRFGLRITLSLLVMCAASWAVRYTADVLFTNLQLRGLGYSTQVLILFLLFLVSYLVCYCVSTVEATYMSILAMTIFKIAWNGFKTGSSLFLVSEMEILWSQYSPFGSLVSYLVYFGICLLCCAIYKMTVKEPTIH